MLDEYISALRTRQAESLTIHFALRDELAHYALYILPNLSMMASNSDDYIAANLQAFEG